MRNPLDKIQSIEKYGESVAFISEQGRIAILDPPGSLSYNTLDLNNKLFNLFANRFTISDQRIQITKDLKNLICSNSNIIYLDRQKKIIKSIVGANSLDSNGKPTRILSTSFDYKHYFVFCTTNKFYKLIGSEKIELKKLSKLKIQKIEFIGDKLVCINQSNQLLVIDNYDDQKNIRISNIETSEKIKYIKVISKNYLLYTTIKNNNFLLKVDQQGYSQFSVVDLVAKTNLKDILSDSTQLYIDDKEGGTVMIPISEIIKNNWMPLLYLKNISSNQPILNQDAMCIDMEYYSNTNLKLNYITLVKYGIEKIIYEYAIVQNKSDTIWQTTLTPQVQFINPKWGSYKVLIRAINSQQQASSIVVTKVNIKKPFYITWWFLSFAFLSVIALTFYITKRIQNKKRNQELQEKEDEKKFLTAEFKALNALMNPHFIFNSLNNIQGFINSDDKKKANEYLEIFAQLVRQNMKNAHEGLISLEKEITLVKNYLLLEKMRMGDKLNYTININEEIDLSEIEVPPLTIQPIVENSVKHGIFPLKDREGHIDIQVTENKDTISIVILDTGIGFSLSEKSEDSNSISIENTQKRFANLSKILGKEITIRVEDRKNGEDIIGTKAEIIIKETTE